MDLRKSALEVRAQLDAIGLEVQRTKGQDTYAAAKARRTHRILATLLLAIETAERRLAGEA